MLLPRLRQSLALAALPLLLLALLTMQCQLLVLLSHHLAQKRLQ
jgi:hypothetical protein